MDEVSLKNLLRGGEDSRKRQYGPVRMRSNSLDRAVYLKSKKLTVFGNPSKISVQQKDESKEDREKRRNLTENNNAGPHRPRSVSLGQMPNSSLQTKARMSVVRRDSGRLKARIEATAAGLEELDILRKAQQSLISEAKQLLLNKPSFRPTGKETSCSPSTMKAIPEKFSFDLPEEEGHSAEDKNMQENPEGISAPDKKLFSADTLKLLPEEVSSTGNEHSDNASDDSGNSSIQDVDEVPVLYQPKCSPKIELSESTVAETCHKFKEPAKLPGSDMSFSFPSPMHAVLLQYDKPKTEVPSLQVSEPRNATDTKQDMVHKGNLNPEGRVTDFIHQLVKRSPSFKKPVVKPNGHGKPKYMPNGKASKLPQEEINGINTRNGTTMSLSGEPETGRPQQGKPQKVNEHILRIKAKVEEQKHKNNRENILHIKPFQKCHSAPVSPKNKGMTFSFPEGGVDSAALNSALLSGPLRSIGSNNSCLSLNSTDGGYYSNPSSPRGSLNRKRLSLTSDASSISIGSLGEEKRLQKCRTQSSGKFELPKPSWSQRPRSNSYSKSAQSVTPAAVLRRHSFSVSSRLSQKFKPETILFSAKSIDDVQDTMI